MESSKLSMFSSSSSAPFTTATGTIEKDQSSHAVRKPKEYHGCTVGSMKVAFRNDTAAVWSSTSNRWMVLLFIVALLLNIYSTIDNHFFFRKRACDAKENCSKFSRKVRSKSTDSTIVGNDAVFRMATAQEIGEENKETQSGTDSDLLSPCTFEQLSQAFGSEATGSSKEERQKKDDNDSPFVGSSSQCWSLEERILRIPVTSVVNRDTMPTLGKGNSGGVYQAILRLTKHETTSSFATIDDGVDKEGQYCTVALKTDHCFDKEQNSVEDKENSYPCVATGVDVQSAMTEETRGQQQPLLRKRKVEAYKSFLKGEYTGALHWYAQMETKRYQKGLLPTWGLVESGDSEQTATRALGVILPLQPMTMTVQDLMRQPSGNTMDPRRVAKLMIPAARGLAFLADMGLVHQDVHEKNIGIVAGDRKEEEYAILYDYSWMSVASKDSDENNSICAASKSSLNVDKETFVPCNFCAEPDQFPHPDRMYAWRENLGPIGSDMTRFRYIILQLLEKQGRHAPRSIQLEQMLRTCRTAHDLVQVLTDFLQQER